MVNNLTFMVITSCWFTVVTLAFNKGKWYFEINTGTGDANSLLMKMFYTEINY